MDYATLIAGAKVIGPYLLVALVVVVASSVVKTYRELRTYKQSGQVLTPKDKLGRFWRNLNPGHVPPSAVVIQTK
jgi:cell division protein FtsL